MSYSTALITYSQPVDVYRTAAINYLSGQLQIHTAQLELLNEQLNQLQPQVGFIEKTPAALEWKPNGSSHWKITYQSPLQKEEVERIEKELDALVEQINSLSKGFEYEPALTEQFSKLKRLVVVMSKKIG
ncbi:MAG: hypothetical protein LLG04_08795 [Parachlamydia sp.]|nr:hypothetical protein [Parachlamydia sp.]